MKPAAGHWPLIAGAGVNQMRHRVSHFDQLMDLRIDAPEVLSGYQLDISARSRTVLGKFKQGAAVFDRKSE
jgi:hypothetical protein